jgi:hypothetical protein
MSVTLVLNSYEHCHGNAVKGFSALWLALLNIKSYLLCLANNCHGLKLPVCEVCFFCVKRDRKITVNGEEVRMTGDGLPLPISALYPWKDLIKSRKLQSG